MTFTIPSPALHGTAISCSRLRRLGSFFSWSKATPRARRVPSPRTLASAAVAVLLAACGGGTSQYEPFVAQRVLVLGDELSAIDSTGRKYGVNGLTVEPVAQDCAAEPNWAQQVASYYSLVFKDCNPGKSTTLNAIMRAAAGAKVADIAAQVEAQAADGGFRDKDLALVLGGMNDILELYARYSAGTQSLLSLQAEAQLRGERLAAVVNRLIELQAKVIVSTVPDLGFSPLAAAEEALRPGSAAALSELTRVFNERLGVKVLLDGRYVGLMQTDLRTQLAARFPGAYGLVNATAAACDPATSTEVPATPLRYCTTSTLVSGATSGSYFWAYGTQLAGGGQAQLAGLAIDRARQNPF
jgi:outer membrane lipase/esterase